MSDERVIRGSCLCGGVRFEVHGEPVTMAYCHCSRCRKAGSPANVAVRARDFRWVQGQDLVVRYVADPPWKLVRCFCRVCGTCLGEPETHPEVFPISAHALDDDPGIRPVLHEHVASKPSWYEIDDDLPRYPEDPPVSAFFPDRSRD